MFIPQLMNVLWGGCETFRSWGGGGVKLVTAGDWRWLFEGYPKPVSRVLLPGPPQCEQPPSAVYYD